MRDQTALKLAMRRIFRPFSRLAIARGLSFQDAQNILKQAFVDTAELDFKIDGKHLTDSRISLLTGLQRRDIKQITERESLAQTKPNPLQRVHSQLLASGQSTMSLSDFNSLTRAQYQDIHPRTFLDELTRLELIEIQEQTILIAPKTLISDDDETRYAIFADNLTAHARSSVANMLGEPAALEQAVYASHLTPEDAKNLQDFARLSAQSWLLAINERALELQKKNKGDKTIRIGLYFNEKDQD